MRALIFTILLIPVFFSSASLAQAEPDYPADCHAAFVANPDAGNPMLFHFQDQSSGQITHWQWSFGDGGTSAQQNPAHNYAAGGTYFVCLTISNSDSGFICHDMICIPVTVHEPGTCVADYIYSRDSLTNLTVKFTDKSSGNIKNWHWNFGDGTVSADRNPHHTFPSAGKYNVCLQAYNADSISLCNDIKCDSLNLLPASGPCKASFISELDSMNRSPNTFTFTNGSTGNPNHYRWNFDDGSSSASRDVTHQFHVEGDHQVCLLIRKEVQGVTTCLDSLCKTVKTAKYYNLGGHLFAGSYPINNPVSTGDTGLAFLYRKEGSRLIPYDTSRFTNLGYYAFPEILNGSYLLKTALTEGSAHYTNYFPAYYGQTLKWQEASLVNLSDSSVYGSNIELLPIVELLSGPGIIQGDVVKSGSVGNQGELPFAEVILYNARMDPLQFTQSDKSGRFELNNLPNGDYYLYVETPGYYSRLTPIWLNASNPQADSVRLEVFDYNVTGISDKTNPSVLAGELFPNPANSEVNLVIQVQNNMRVNFEIRTITGLVIHSGSVNCHLGRNVLLIPLASIQRGVYIFTVNAADGSGMFIKKLIKY